VVAGERHPDLIVMPVRVLTLAPVIAQVVSGSKRIFNSDFEHRTPKNFYLFHCHSTAGAWLGFSGRAATLLGSTVICLTGCKESVIAVRSTFHAKRYLA